MDVTWQKKELILKETTVSPYWSQSLTKHRQLQNEPNPSSVA